MIQDEKATLAGQVEMDPLALKASQAPLEGRVSLVHEVHKAKDDVLPLRSVVTLAHHVMS